jgi:hypothetical protein
MGINIDFIGLFQGDFSNFIQFGAESSQWWSGMGVVVIFGLFFATALTLIAVPMMYDISESLTEWVKRTVLGRQIAREERKEMGGEPQAG